MLDYGYGVVFDDCVVVVVGDYVDVEEVFVFGVVELFEGVFVLVVVVLW